MERWDHASLLASPKRPSKTAWSESELSEPEPASPLSDGWEVQRATFRKLETAGGAGGIARSGWLLKAAEGAAALCGSPPTGCATRPTQTRRARATCRWTASPCGPCRAATAPSWAWPWWRTDRWRAPPPCPQAPRRPAACSAWHAARTPTSSRRPRPPTPRCACAGGWLGEGGVGAVRRGGSLRACSAPGHASRRRDCPPRMPTHRRGWRQSPAPGCSA